MTQEQIARLRKLSADNPSPRDAIDETYRRNVEHCEEIKRLTARNVELEASAVNTDSMLADQAARFNEEIVELTAERDAAVECAAQEAKYNNSLRDELAKNVVLTAERDAYQIAADKMAMEHKIERDALSVQVDALAKDAARMQDALIWIAAVNAMDYEYQAKAKAAIAKEQA